MWLAARKPLGQCRIIRATTASQQYLAIAPCTAFVLPACDKHLRAGRKTTASLPHAPFEFLPFKVAAFKQELRRDRNIERSSSKRAIRVSRDGHRSLP